MKHLGTFKSLRWGTVSVLRATYDSSTGPLAILLELEDGKPLAKLSVNLYRPVCSHDSKDLPAGCFYAKNYSGQEGIAAEAMASGLFRQRDDLPKASAGWIDDIPVWEIVS